MIALRRFWQEEQGQDFVEWILLIGFIVLGSAALFYQQGGVTKIWTTTSSTLVTAAAPLSGH